VSNFFHEYAAAWLRPSSCARNITVARWQLQAKPSVTARLAQKPTGPGGQLAL
jgi:hypothetical protein